jgi:hypothetical protein
LVAAITATLALAACGDDGDDSSSPTSSSEAATEVPEVRIEASDFAFDAPASIPAGLTTLTIDNVGAEPHQAGLFRLADGKTPDDLLAALPAGFGAALEDGELLGGPNGASAGESASVDQVLEPGSYVLACLIPSVSDGVPHIVKGMMAPLEITESDASADLPDAETTLTLEDFNFSPSNDDEFDGQGTIEIVNDGSQPHEAVVGFLPDGTTVDDFITFGVAPPFQPLPPQPYVDIGGITATKPGERSVIDLDLEPGNYVLACFLPNLDNEMSNHIAEGMVFPFTVEE